MDGGNWWWPWADSNNEAAHYAAPEIVVEVVEPEVFLAPAHPYYPAGVPIPAYEPNEAPLPVLLASLGGMLGFALLGTSAIALKANPNLSKSNLALFCWFVLSKLTPGK